ncbi:MAG: GIY-YIG nuclease family protein [Candidatus Omnitrophica bacterium]|nr:GIY-YIG nuclease family protein [Candidatus Omnitrophota bacterium]
MKPLKKHYIYLVQCVHGTYYAGYTNDLKKRMEAHNHGRGAKYLRGRTPVQLKYWEICQDYPSALRKEWAIKKLTRKQKGELCSKFPLIKLINF